MLSSIVSAFAIGLVGFFLLWVVTVTILAVLGKLQTPDRSTETPRMRRRRERFEASNNRRIQAMALGLAGESWSFALGALIAIIAKRRPPTDEVTALGNVGEQRPNDAAQPTPATDTNGQREQRETARAADRSG